MNPFQTLGRFLTFASLLVCFALLIAKPIFGEEKLRGSRPAPDWDTYSDTWMATDALGRTVATHDEVGPPRPDRWVGIFYFLWHGAHVNGGPWDITRILNIDPEAMEKTDSPLWGPLHAPHHWGESLFGYYVGDDRWVLRKHADMLTAAGVDTLIFDTSNKVIYEQYYTPLFETYSEMRAEGNATPYVAFLTPFWDPASTVRELYDKIYSKGFHEDLWFRWEGKPLILANPEQVDPELREFFTFRRPQPSYFEGPKYFGNGKRTGSEEGPEPNMWSWLEIFPQHVFPNERGEKEQMSVGVAQNAVRDPNAPPIGDYTGIRLGTLSEAGSLGRNYHEGKDEEAPDAVLHGYNFAEQWERALEEDPLFVFVTGWNEWFGGRFKEFLGVKRPVMFVDTFNQEHSRDVEPMKGGHGDNYYYQMADYIRRYKGARPLPEASEPKTIDIRGDFDQWSDVAPEYRDAIGDTAHRNHHGYNTITRYTNTTGRNDLMLMKVARDATSVYFYAQTREAISDYTDPDWMTLFLNTDRNPDTGWQGYDFVINRRLKDDSTSVIEHTENGWNWQPKGEAKFTVRGNELMLAAPRDLLGLAGDENLDIEFKWADNFQTEDDIDAFTVNGDSAPLGRFNFRYR
ncbi:MAG: hypothetical protein KC978_11545 [Candidatus Omnitrophica bacterium]|nr:hypothetical protein [Candidatus Omnitrophota bacterium]